MLTVNNLNGFDAQAASNNVLVFTINVNTDTDRFLLTTALTSAGWDGITPVAVTVVNTATIYSSVPGTAAFRTGTIPAGSSIYLDSTAGSILGAGGLVWRRRRLVHQALRRPRAEVSLRLPLHRERGRREHALPCDPATLGAGPGRGAYALRFVRNPLRAHRERGGHDCIWRRG